MPIPPSIARRLGKAMITEELDERLQGIHFRDAGHGYDPFGLHPDFVHFGAGISHWLYQRYFRVISEGSDNIPSEGAAILAVNHSGLIPMDGLMLWHDVLAHTDPPRVARGIADHFVPALPFIGTLFARGGMVGGSRGNVRVLLEAGEMLMIFPEGTPGIVKPFSERYNLQPFRVGHAELAIRHQVPIVPVGIVGAEEQLPSFFASKRLGRLAGFSALPIPLLPIPLPVRYRIIYGEALYSHIGSDPAIADDPAAVQALAAEVQSSVDGLLRRGLAAREGIFR
jgi:1-acyl-sn-glycerol-3-phosphate acyltransferase